MTPVFVTSVLVDEEGQLFLNGEPFPYYIAADGLNFRPPGWSDPAELSITVHLMGDITWKERKP